MTPRPVVVALAALALGGVLMPNAIAGSPPLRSDRWVFDLDGRGSTLDVTADLTVAPGQVGLIGYAFALRHQPHELPYAAVAPYVKVFGMPKYTGFRASASGQTADLCTGPVTCTTSADGRRLHFKVSVDPPGTDNHASLYVFVRAATARITPRLGRWRVTKKPGAFAVVSDDAALTTQAQDQRITAGPLTYTTTTKNSLAITGMTCREDEHAQVILIGANDVYEQVCPDAATSGLATTETTWMSVIAGSRDDHRPAVLLVAILS
jgi:hypothetical protein